MMRMMTGIPTIVGVMKEENRFSFILILRGLRGYVCWGSLMQGLGGN